MKKQFLAFLLSLGTLTCLSQSFESLHKQLQEASDNKEYEKAVKLIPIVLAKAEKEIKDSTDKYAFTLNLCGSIYFQVENYPEAEKCFSAAQKKSKDAFGETDDGYALFTFNLAATYSEAGKYTAAEPLFLKSLPILATAYGQGSVEYTRLFNTLGRMYIDMGRWTEAESMGAAVVNYFKEKLGQESPEYLSSLAAMGIIYQNQGKYIEAEEIFLSLVNYFRQIEKADPENFSTLLNNLASLYRTQGRFKEAEPLFLEALTITRKLEKQKPVASATVLNNLALVYKAQGRYPEAESYFKQSIAIYKAAGMQSHPDYTNPVNNVGDLYRIMGRYQQAYDAFQEVIQIRKELNGENHIGYANALNNLALVYDAMGNYQQEEKMLLQCRDLYKKLLGEFDRNYANSLFNLAQLYNKTKRYPEAESYYLSSIGIMKEAFGENNDRYALYLQGLAGFYFISGKTAEAISTFEKAMAIFKKLFNEKHYDYIETELNLAQVLSIEKRFDEAEPYCLHAMQGYSDLIGNYLPVLSDDEKMEFYDKVSTPLEIIRSFVITTARKNPRQDHARLFGAMYNFQLLTKSLLLNESSKNKSLVLASGDTTIIGMYTRLALKKKKLMELYRLSNEELKGIDVRAIEKEANTMAAELSTRSAGLRTNTGAVKWEDIQKRLGAKEAAVEMIHIQNAGNQLKDTAYYAALIITSESKYPKLVILNKGQELEAVYLPAYQKAVRSQHTDEESYNKFWRPISKELEGISTVYFSSDGAYEKLNLNTLKNPKTGSYLLEEKNIVLLTNTADLLSKRGVATTGKFTAELFGFPDYEFSGAKKTIPVTASLSRYGFTYLSELPGTKVEVDSISRIMRTNKWNVNEYLGGEASELKIKEIKDPKVLHVATHGFFLKNPDKSQEKTLGFQTSKAIENPLLRSGIILAGAAAFARDTLQNNKTEDGILTAYEASSLNLDQTDLVVLSACETGLGEVVNGQGVYGLQRAFFVAGAKSIIMSLWPVDDAATQKLMTLFYQQWLINPTAENMQTAFRKAQLKLKESYPAPFFWGAFVMIGK